VKDLVELPANITAGLEIVPVSHVDQVLERALIAPLEAIEWTEVDDLASQPNAATAAASGDPRTAH
jgi:ATP-dependent Lon protease